MSKYGKRNDCASGVGGQGGCQDSSSGNLGGRARIPAGEAFVTVVVYYGIR
jgi:hypothetical protein